MKNERAARGGGYFFGTRPVVDAWHLPSLLEPLNFFH